MTLTTALEGLLIAIIGVIGKFVVDFLNAKREEAKIKTDNELARKYIDLATDTVARCVAATNQTYVDSLKSKEIFDKAAQAEAFKKSLNAALDILNEDAIKYLDELTGDTTQYLTTLIEAEVAKQKQDKGSN